MAPKETSARFHPYKSPKVKHKSQPHIASGLSINDLKRRIRDVKRLLNHADLSPEARIVQERALAGYEKDLKDETERRQRSEMIKRYHFVRFLDRKTATKHLRRLTREQQKAIEERADAETQEKLKQQIYLAQINVNYTIYYPLTEKYISLYPHDKNSSNKRSSTTSSAEDTDSNKNINNSNNNNNNTSSDDEPRRDADGLLEKKPPLWAIVEECTAAGTLDQLRNGKLNFGFDGKPKTTSAVGEKTSTANLTTTANATSSQKSQADSRSKKRSGAEAAHTKPQRSGHDEEDDDSDGGFFEV